MPSGLSHCGNWRVSSLGRCEENPPCSSSLSSRGFPADRPTPTLEILRLSLLKWAVSPLQMPRQKRLAPQPAFTGISGRDGKMKPARSGIMPVTMDLVLKWGTAGPSSRRASPQNHKHNPIPPKNQTWQWHIPMCKWVANYPLPGMDTFLLPEWRRVVEDTNAHIEEKWALTIGKCRVLKCINHEHLKAPHKALPPTK